MTQKCSREDRSQGRKIHGNVFPMGLISGLVNLTNPSEKRPMCQLSMCLPNKVHLHETPWRNWH